MFETSETSGPTETSEIVELRKAFCKWQWIFLYTSMLVVTNVTPEYYRHEWPESQGAVPFPHSPSMLLHGWMQDHRNHRWRLIVRFQHHYSWIMTRIIILALYLYCKITSTKLNPVNRMPAVKNESWKLVNAFYNKLASLEAMLVQNPADLITGVDCRATGAAKNEIPLQSGMSKGL